MKDYARRIRPHTSFLSKKTTERRWVDTVDGDRVLYHRWTAKLRECSMATFLRWAGEEVPWYKPSGPKGHPELVDWTGWQRAEYRESCLESLTNGSTEV